MSTTRGPISQFIEKNYLHFNAAALMDAAKGYESHLAEGGKMMVTLAGAMSTAELGISLAGNDPPGIRNCYHPSCTGGQSRRRIYYEPCGFIRTISVCLITVTLVPRMNGICSKIIITALPIPAYPKRKLSERLQKTYL